jgi:YHS domain-containing protein
MAHQTDVHPVRMDLEQARETVIDPVCGAKLKRHDAKFLLFRPEATLCFCSRECRSRFLQPKRGDAEREAAA